MKKLKTSHYSIPSLLVPQAQSLDRMWMILHFGALSEESTWRRSIVPYLGADHNGNMNEK